MDYEYEEFPRNHDQLKWTANRHVQRCIWWIQTAKKNSYCTICPPNGGENINRDTYPRWKRKRDKAKSKRKGRC